MKNVLFYISFVVVVVIGGSPSFGERFTIAVLPDTQNYVRDIYTQPASSNIYTNETQFIVDNVSAMNIVFVSHLGDVWNDSRYFYSEAVRAISAMDVLRMAGVPMGMVPGNHNYDYSSPAYRPIHGSSYWRSSFGPSSDYFSGKSWYGGAYINSSDTSGMTNWQTFHAGSQDFLHIALEMEPSNDVLAWAQSIINSHAGWPTIISIHEYISPSGSYLGSNYREGYDRNDSQQMWDNFIKVNSQIFMVLCGHSFDGAYGCAYCRISQNNAGSNVYQILSDYQSTISDSNGTLGKGCGWLRLMEFDTDTNTIHVRTYSTLLHKYSNDVSLTDGSSYARSWAPFNYDSEGTGSLLSSSNNKSSDFTIPFPAHHVIYGRHISGLLKSFRVYGSGDWIVAGLAFDPTSKVNGNYDRIYYCNRVATGNQGLYLASISGECSSGRLCLGSVVDAGGPYSCAVDINGNVYVAYANTPQIWKVTDPSGLSPVEMQMLGNYAGTGDDDPQCISIMPHGFGGSFNAGADLVFYDGGTDSDSYESVVTVSSTSTIDTPAYNVIWKDTGGYFSGDLRGCASEYDGYYYLAALTIPKASLNGITRPYINRVNANGTLQRIFLGTDITKGGIKPTLDDSLTVNPVDGSVWAVTANTASSNNPRTVWRIDVSHAILQSSNVYLAAVTAEIDDFSFNVGVNDMTWSPDGKYFVIGCPDWSDTLYVYSAPDCNSPGVIHKTGDLNEDCYVDYKDIVIFASDWLLCTDANNITCDDTIVNLRSDLDKNLYIDFRDLAILAKDWFNCVDPANSACN